MDSDGAGFLALVIGVPLLIFILLICLCCWCCHCCCCARNTQQVVVIPPSNPTNTIVNTTMMTPYSQGYAPLPPEPGYVNHLYAAHQHHHQRPPAADDRMLFSESPPRGHPNDCMDPVPREHHIVSMHNSQPESEYYPEDRSAMPLEQAKPPPYSALK